MIIIIEDNFADSLCKMTLLESEVPRPELVTGLSTNITQNVETCPCTLSIFDLGTYDCSYLTELDEGCVHDRHEVLEADVAAEPRRNVHELHDRNLRPADLLHVAHLLFGWRQFITYHSFINTEVIS